MELIFPEAIHFDCGACGRCCRGWSVAFDESAWRRVKGSALFERLEREHGEAPAVADENAPHGPPAICRLRDGACAFLSPDRACLIHRELGPSAKPFGCSLFPFLVRPTPDGVHVGVSFYCSAVQANHGRPLHEHAGDIERARQAVHFAPIGDTVPFDAGHVISWALYRDVESECLQTLRSAPNLSDGLWLAHIRIVLASSLLDRALIPPAEAWERAHRAEVARNEAFRQLEDMLLVHVLGALESGDEAQRKANTEALFFRGQANTESFGPVDIAHLEDFRRRFDASWSHLEIRRYLEHLLFRKQLVHSRNVAANAAAWRLVLPLLEWYRDLSAFTARRKEPDLTDLHRALEEVERSFMLHATRLDDLFETLARRYRRLLEQQQDELRTGGLHDAHLS